ncbi:hypothetical protein NC652_033694 [Populus alba x Populus x berolinensis]|uniref:Uncharacterized protein n=1 Tax=Populus tomentosa TaxID=118781 RepID=A0A8X7YFM8_POPTO|nr:hypothetical protein POTOM_047185 [Populus tomentosa]KAJ6880427.1 hypothetical protein NC652_033694 [Populus alba x Populus x berolinensis]
MANVTPFNILCWQHFGWAPQEAKMQMVTSEVLGPNPRLLFQLYALEQSSYYQKVLEEKDSRFEDIVDAYLAFLQVTVVNPAMDKKHWNSCKSLPVMQEMEKSQKTEYVLVLLGGILQKETTLLCASKGQSFNCWILFSL